MEAIQQTFFLGQKGTIISGEHPGWIVEFVNDTQETGGYFAYLYDPQSTEAFDWWFEAATWIPKFIKDMNWHIDWHTASPTDSSILPQ
jgi:hypothetical protein